MNEIYIAAGVRTPFVKAGTKFAQYSAIELSVPIIASMVDQASPDFIIWGQVIPNPTLSNLGRELSLEAGLDPAIPGMTSVLACATSMLAAIQAGGMMNRGGAHLALVGGVETMSKVPIALNDAAANRLLASMVHGREAAEKSIGELGLDDFNLPSKGWANRRSGRSMGEHTEDTAKNFGISREVQDRIALNSHHRAAASQSAGFFDDLLAPVGGITSDTMIRPDTSYQKLSALSPVFDTNSGNGTLTAGNSSPLTDGAAGLYVGDVQGMMKVPHSHIVRLVDWQLAAMSYGEEGILMAPARAIPVLLARHQLSFEDVALWEIHEAFAAQVAANLQAMGDAEYQRRHTGITADMGCVNWDAVNPNGGSLALGHPFGATGARILSQAAKTLSGMQSGSKAVVSVCADGGQGAVVLLEAP